MKKIRQKGLQLLMSFLMVFTMMPLASQSISAENRSLTVYFDARNHSEEELGLWFWGETIPEEALPSQWMVDDYHFEPVDGSHYVKTEIPLVQAEEHDIGYLIVSHNGENEKIFEEDGNLYLPNTEVNEVWIDKDNQVHYMEPSPEKDILRVYLQLEGRQASDMSAWVWGDAFDDSVLGSDFDKDRLEISGEKDGFVYFDLKLQEDFDPHSDLGFLFHDGQTQTSDYHYQIASLGNTIYTQWNDESIIHDNPFFIGSRLLSARWLTNQTIQLRFDTIPEDIETKLQLTVADEKVDYRLEIKDDLLILHLSENDFLASGQWKVHYEDQTLSVPLSWEIKDSLYATDVELGLTWTGNKPTLRFWSPSADAVFIHVYDAQNPEKELFQEAMHYDEEDKVWLWSGQQSDLKDAYYQIRIERGAESVFVLDPYAKSMAPWNRFDLDSNCNSTRSECVAKAAFVDPNDAKIDLDYASIEDYQGREDAIIYETHVRDFTSDKNIENELNSPFGTFDAFIEKLDYLEKLGVTHIQLLPIMSYYFINETARNQRVLDPTAQGEASNYNWGYDPHSYFSISGFYSKDPSNPSLRILEFKNLVNEIHQRGMGVILDVVYNHTAQVSIFEDLEPEYYHFMDAQNNPKTSFGGGRLGTTHAMSRKVLIDSIEYWTKEFKVDGFRFDMMGDHDAETIQMAYNQAYKHNPNTLFLGEGWRTYEGDDQDPRQAADQDWMKDTSDVGVFSDEYRNMMKSGFPNEGSPQFLTGGAQDIKQLFKNIQAQPGNIPNDEPQDIVQYLEAHDNLTLHDVIAISIKKSPQEYQKEILQRQRLGNLMLFTSQGSIFMHSGQEYGRTRQVFAEDEKASQMDKLHVLKDQDGQLIKYPYFVSDAYNSSDAINHFDWDKVSNEEKYPEHVQTYRYTQGLIELRKNFKAFRLSSLEEINDQMELLWAKEMNDQDLILAYRIHDANDSFYVIVNADNQKRSFTFDRDIHRSLQVGTVLADKAQVDINGIDDVEGLTFNSQSLDLDPLTAVIIKTEKKETPELDFNYKDRLNNKAILHTWNWSFKEIENELEAIAEAGYQAIQTSPLQPIKEEPKDGSEWWLLYQPLDFAFSDHLGSREEFESMIAKAHALEIDVLVDVVFNHLANDEGGDKACIPSKKIAERFKDESMWHSYECVSDWDDRNEVTQKGIGLPDLNTEHPKVQEYAIEYLNELLAMGVDGFRFDAAKHIELPNDSGVQGTFWPNVLSSLDREDIYVYGEILQDSQDDFTYYSEIMDVTASNYGYVLMDVVKGSSTNLLLDYRAHQIDPSHLLTWIESHDTYANDNGASVGLSDQNIRLAWSVLAGRKDHTSLFFNRPKPEVKGKFASSIGEKGDELWKDEVIVALNHFSQRMGQENEYLRFPNESSVLIERGQKGLLITNFSSKNLKLENFKTSFADGHYVNTLNPDESFDIVNGEISGDLAAESIAILYQDSDLPQIQSNYHERKFKDSLSLLIQVDDATKAEYRLNGGDWIEFEEEIQLELGKDDVYLQEYKIDVRAKNQHGTVGRSFKYQKAIDENLTVYFKKPSDWDDEVFLYAYDVPGEVLGLWPGSPMEKVSEDWYRYAFDEDVSFARILFNANGKQYPLAGKEGIMLTETIWVDETFNIHEENPELDYRGLMTALEPIRENMYSNRYQNLKQKYNENLLKARTLWTQEELDELVQEINKSLSSLIRKESEKEALKLMEELKEQKEKWRKEYEGVESEAEMQAFIQKIKDELASTEETPEETPEGGSPEEETVKEKDKGSEDSLKESEDSSTIEKGQSPSKNEQENQMGAGDESKKEEDQVESETKASEQETVTSLNDENNPTNLPGTGLSKSYLPMLSLLLGSIIFYLERRRR